MISGDLQLASPMSRFHHLMRHLMGMQCSRKQRLVLTRVPEIHLAIQAENIAIHGKLIIKVKIR